MSENRHSSMGIHGLHTHEAAHKIHRLRLFGRAKKFGLTVLGLMLVGAAIVMGMRIARGNALAESARDQSRLYVNVISPKSNAGNNILTLPGTLQGFVEAPIYARASGYVEQWYKDIGAHVNKGDLLAQISTPEVSQQLMEAKAAQEQAITNAQLAKTSFERWDSLRKRDAVSQQELDERRNALTFANAAQASAAATVKRLQEMVGYSRIVAPFSGVVTKRNIDIGTLVDAGSGTKLLFTLSKIDPLRVYVYVPQNYAPQIQVGSKTDITFKEMPGKVFAGSIVRSAGAIDPVTRTLQVEINLPNADGKLLPGAYAEVAIKGRGTGNNALSVPSNALLFRPAGTKVGIVGADNKVHLQPVTISRELGVTVELQGVTPQDKVIINPPDSLADGDVVSVMPAKEAASDGKATAKDSSKPADKATTQPAKGSAS